MISPVLFDKREIMSSLMGEKKVDNFLLPFE